MERGRLLVDQVSTRADDRPYDPPMREPSRSLDDAVLAHGRWLLDRLAEIGGGGEDAVDIDAVESAFGPRTPGFDDGFVRRVWATAARRMGHGRLVDSEPFGSTAARLLLEVEDGRRFWLSYEVEADPPHRLIRFNTSPAVPAGLTIRQAERPADGPALARLEREAPIVLSDRSIRFDFDDDDGYFSTWDLLEDPGAVVAETEDDGIVASVQLSIVPFRVGGRDYRGGYTHRVRTHPSRSGQGLLQHLTTAGLEAKPVGSGGSMDALVVVIAKGNDQMLKGWAGRPGEWPAGPTRFVIVAAAAASTAEGDAATVTPGLDEVTRILNAGHHQDEGFVPYTFDTLAARLARAAELYGPADLVRLGEAVLGVWRAGEHLRTIITTADGDKHVQRRAIAADWGVVPGHEEDLRRLIGSTCTDLVRRGLTHLCVYASPPTPGWELLTTLPAERDEFHLWTLPVQPGPPELGTYVDALAF